MQSASRGEPAKRHQQRSTTRSLLALILLALDSQAALDFLQESLAAQFNSDMSTLSLMVLALQRATSGASIR